jgi:transposase-like protein
MLFKIQQKIMNCIHCHGKCIKKGKINNVQRYLCTCCGKTQQEIYNKPRIPTEKYDIILSTLKKSVFLQNHE